MYTSLRLERHHRTHGVHASRLRVVASACRTGTRAGSSTWVSRGSLRVSAARTHRVVGLPQHPVQAGRDLLVCQGT